MEQEGLSPYHFCANDPTNHTDPTGLGNGKEPYNPGNSSSGGDGGGDGNTKITNTTGQAQDGQQGYDGGVGGYENYQIPYTFVFVGPVSYTPPADAPTAGAEVTPSPLHTLDVNETSQDLAAITPPATSSSTSTIGDFVAATTGTFGTVIASEVSAAASEVSNGVSRLYTTAILAGTVAAKMTMNSVSNSLSHFSLADVSIGGGPLSLAEGELGALDNALGMGGGEIINGETKSIISVSEFKRIENAATRINKPITVVGSQASGTATANSDWDYVIEGLTSGDWKKIKNSLPGSKSSLDNVSRNIDIFNEPVNTNLPHITINPR